ncbi:RDD family protein [Halosegnis marinus]|uniref:RDD family protein n=1 Tax=Halosegnis marinus TaxID=3034023 RepID=A0ABD5ZKU4_9EURY|nr:RDD family protein [Halosegnis sp. DT85]
MTWASRLLSVYPSRPAPEPALDSVGSRAVLADRVAAAAFDLLACLVVVEAPLLWMADTLTAGAVGDSPLFLPVALAAAAPLVVTYSFAFEWRYARTPGKVWRRLVVVDDDGDPCSLRASAVRNLLRYVDYLGVPPVVVGTLAALTGGGKRVGDRAAGTVVARSR